MARLIAPPSAETTGAPGGDPQRPGPDRLAGARRTAVATWERLAAVPARLWAVGTLVVVLVAALLAFELSRPNPTPAVTQKDVDTAVQKGVDAQAKAQAAAPPAATVAYQAIQPSLVLITTKRTTAAGAEQASGAGVIVKTDGTILTALHVVSGADSVTVSYTDGTSSPATVVTQTPDSDIATLLPSTLPQTLVPAVLGGGVQVGSPVFAVGHPLGLADSLSAGVVSALDRTVKVGDGKSLQHLIQIDAAVNPGNSGGPLLNAAGQVVGIVTGLANPSQQGFFVGIGFAVPIATAGGAAGSPPQ